MKPSVERDEQVADTIRILGGGDLNDLVGHAADIGHITLTALRNATRLGPSCVRSGRSSCGGLKHARTARRRLSHHACPVGRFACLV